MALTDEARRLLRRYRDDRLFYFERALKIRTKDSLLIPLHPNPIQAALDAEIEAIRRRRKPVRLIVLKARRHGVSTYVAGYCFHDTATRRYRESLVIAHDDDSTNTLFRMQTLMFDELPDALRPMKRYSNRSELLFENPDEAKRRTNPGLRSSLRVATAGTKNAGRSKTLHNLHCSEVAFWPDAKTTLLSILQTVDRNPDTFVCLESTANGLGGEFHDRYQLAKAGKSEYTALFFAWFANPEYAIPGTPDEDAELLRSLDAEETELADRHGLSLSQLRWRRFTIANECGGDGELFRQEYPSNDIEAFIVPGNCFFDTGILRRLFGETSDGLKGDVIDGGFVTSSDGYLQVWEPPEPGDAYVIGGDVAEGIEGGDYSVLQVLRRSDLAQVAEWHGHIDADAFGRTAVDVARWYNGAWLGIEVNNHGLTTNKAAAATGYVNLYHRQTGHDQQFEESPSDRLGWRTDVQTRRPMLDGLKAALREGATRPNGGGFVRECTTFIRKPNGEPTGAEGAHDDRVIAYAIALKMHELCPMPLTTPIKEPVYTPRSRRAGY